MKNDQTNIKTYPGMKCYNKKAIIIYYNRSVRVKPAHADTE